MTQDKIEQLKTAMKAKKDAESRVAAAQERGGMSPGVEDQYQARLSELESSLEQARAQVAEQEAKAGELNDKCLRLYAESENARKRAAKEKEEALRYGNEKFIKELLPVIDGLEQALTHAESGDQASMAEGIQLVLKQFFKVLETFGVSPVDAVGLPFDPYHHEAMAHHESDEHEPHSVVSQYRRGYKLHDRLIRPSLVTVAKPRAGKP